jgi:hypothetical protein
VIAVASLGLTGPVLARDMQSSASYDWSGIYAGVHAGYGGDMTGWPGINFLSRGPLVGGQLGINKQVGNFVIGIEADAAWSSVKGWQFEEVSTPLSPFVFQATAASKVKDLGDAGDALWHRGRSLACLREGGLRPRVRPPRAKSSKHGGGLAHAAIRIRRGDRKPPRFNGWSGCGIRVSRQLVGQG